MFSKRLKAVFCVTLLGAVLGVTIQPAKGQDLKGFSRPRTVTKATSVRTIPNGEKVTLAGNVTRGEGDTFSVCDLNGAETIVVMTPSTRITTHRIGIFRGPMTMDKAALLVGLKVQVRGRGNDSGQLAANWVRFHYADFRSQTQLDTRAIPIEAEQVRQGEQLEETGVVATSALKNAKTAQDSADKAQESAYKAQDTADVAKSDAATAQTTAVAAHTKIAAIDDFEPTNNLIVNFRAGSALLTADSKSKLDEFASKTVSAKGFVIELSGFASKEGGHYYNHELSARRAEAVLDYLVGVCNVPIRRIVVPYSAGILNPIADNNTRAGREQNRRVEVKMLVSRGLAASENVAAHSDK